MLCMDPRLILSAHLRINCVLDGVPLVPSDAERRAAPTRPSSILGWHPELAVRQHLPPPDNSLKSETHPLRRTDARFALYVRSPLHTAQLQFFHAVREQ